AVDEADGFVEEQLERGGRLDEDRAVGGSGGDQLGVGGGGLGGAEEGEQRQEHGGEEPQPARPGPARCCGCHDPLRERTSAVAPTAIPSTPAASAVTLQASGPEACAPPALASSWPCPVPSATARDGAGRARSCGS